MNPKKNNEGYSDPTAYFGTKEIVREDDALQKEVSQLVHVLKDVSALAGFEIIGRITLKHRRTKRTFH